MRDIVYWIWLSLSVTPGTNTFGKLIKKFGSAKEIFSADETDIATAIGSRSRDFAAVMNRDTQRAERILEFCEKKGVGILTYFDEKYPDAFRRISTPPVLLYYRGTLPDFASECFISMVGMRKLTDYGRRNAFVIGYDLACAGAVIVSGMAIGIDGVSHAGSLSAGGINVAFLGSGIDVCYPEQHKTLAREIVKRGCIMTEYPPTTRPLKHNFPRRNRLIAALSCTTVVIEGRMRSGAVITAKFAREFGKALYALPGNVDNVTSEVTNVLIKNGAKLITSAVDIVADLEYIYLGKLFLGKIKPKPEVSMDKVLSDFAVCCVCPSDDIFPNYSGRRRRSSNPKSKQIKRIDEINAVVLPDTANDTPDFIENLNFDKDTLRIYKKIPVDGDCAISELVDGKDKMHIVMKALLRLELGKFVVLLPGERVKRNLK